MAQNDVLRLQLLLELWMNCISKLDLHAGGPSANSLHIQARPHAATHANTDSRARVHGFQAALAGPNSSTMHARQIVDGDANRHVNREKHRVEPFRIVPPTEGLLPGEDSASTDSAHQQQPDQHYYFGPALGMTTTQERSNDGFKASQGLNGRNVHQTAEEQPRSSRLSPDYSEYSGCSYVALRHLRLSVAGVSLCSPPL